MRGRRSSRPEPSRSPGIGWHQGTLLTLTDATPGSTSSVRVRIVGLYRPKSVEDPFWFGFDYFTEGEDQAGVLRIDPVFVARAEFDRVTDGEARAFLDYPFRPETVRLADVPRLRATVDRLERLHPDTAHLAITTSLDEVLDGAAHQQELVDVGTLLVTLQLSLLGWLVLFQIVVDLAEARGPEIALAKLRGHRPWQVLRFGSRSPWCCWPSRPPSAWSSAASPRSPSAPRCSCPAPPSSSPFPRGRRGRRVRRRDRGHPPRRRTRAAPPRAGAVAPDADVEAAVEDLPDRRRRHDGARGGRPRRSRTLDSGGTDDTAALLAPGLLVLAVALLGVRLLPLVVRLTLPATRATTWIGLFLATRQVVRRPAGVRLATLLAVAAGLASFAVGAEGAAVGNRLARAQAEIGAATVVDVQIDERADPVQAVRRMDPGGTWAMAAATWLPDGGGSVTGTVLAVDAARLGAVAAPARGGLPPSALARSITPKTVPVLTIRATRIEATITASQVRPGFAPSVQFGLLTPLGAPVVAESGVLTNGTRRYSAPIPCAAGCIFTGLTWDRPVSITTGEMSGTALVTAIRAGRSGDLRPVAARLTDPAAWRAAAPVSEWRDRVSVSRAGVLDHFSGESGYGGVAYASAPAVLPAVSAPGGLVGAPKGPPTVVDAFGRVAPFRTVARTPVLPQVLDEGVLMDASSVMSLLPAFRTEASWQVWLSPSAPPDALQRLAHAGLAVQRVTTTAEREAFLGRQGPALSLLLLLASAIVGAVLAAVGTAVSIGASARRRSYELAALHAVGVRRASLFRAAVAEQSLLLLTALAIGIPGGLLAAFLALPVIPEFATETPVALVLVPYLPPVLVFAAAFVLLVLVAAVVSAAAVLARSGPGRLREAEE